MSRWDRREMFLGKGTDETTSAGDDEFIGREFFL